MKGDLVHGRRGKLQKDKVVSGRLIVKKKGDETSTAVSSAKQKGLYSKKEKKRKQVPTDSESDEDLLVSSRRKVACGATRGSNGSAASKNSTLDYSKSKGDFGSDRKKTRSEQIKLGDDAQSVMNRFPEDDFESKRSRLDVFEYTDDPIVDTKKLNKEAIDGDAIDTSGHCILSLKSREPSSRRRELGNDVSRSTVVEKRRKTVFGSSSFLAEQEQETDCLDEKNKFEGNTVSTLRKKSRNSGDDTIRLPGKNGVLKVMIKNKEVLGSGKPYSYQETEENGNDSESGDTSIWNTPLYPLYLKNKSRDEPGSSVTKNQLNMQKFSQAEDINALSKLDLKEMDLTSTKKGVKSKGKKNIKDEIPSPMLKEGRGKCSSTKKQLLRNQIQDMLLGAGWTIDRRPRRNRNYFDSVYINPTGTGYWSIVNAYEALKREYEDKNSGSESGRTKFYFSPIPDEVLATLTRQTRKKIEKEKKQKLKSKKGSKGVEEAMELQKRSAKNKHFLKRAWRSKDGGKIRSVFKNASKFPKGRLKDNDAETLLHEESNSSAISHKGMPKSVRSQKSSSHLLPGKKKKKSSGYALLVRGSHTGVNSDGDDFIPYSGKRTVLSWLIDSGTVPLSGKVQYKNKRRTRVMLEGWITPDGIHCGCCSKIVTVSKFEIHAGSKLRQPFQNIFVESGISLLQCQLDAWNRQEDSERRGFHFVDFDGDDPNDDTCGICGDGGDLICCDGCPSTFHQSCLGIQMLPAGDWHCPNCSCRFCGGVGSSIVQKDPVTTSAIPKCGLCEKKYHQLCAGETEAELVDTNNPHSNFCGFKCKQIFEQLQKLLGVKHELEDGISWTLVQRCDLDSDLSPRVLPQRAECNSKLAVALAVMDECFLPIVDRRSGINLIHNVLYSSGSNFNRLNYCGFYTIILERGDEIISAASIRIHGTRLAEMPFIGTRHIYRRQGMCRRLLNTIESVLCSLNVEKLIIPAISELMHTWTVVFGFKPLEELHKQEMRSMNMLVFPGADLLQKFLLKYELSEGNVSAVEVVEPIMVQSSCNRPKAATVYDRGCVAEPDVAASDEGVVRDDQEKNEVSAVGSGFQDNGGSSHDTSDVMQGPLDGPASVNVCASDEDVVCDSQVKIDEVASVRSGFENISGLSHDTSDSMCNPSDDPGQPMCQAFKERTTSYKLAEGSIDSASLHSCPTKDEPVEGKKPLLDSAMACPTQSSSEGEQDCFLEVKLDVADTKPAKTGLCSLEEISLQKTTEIIE